MRTDILKRLTCTDDEFDTIHRALDKVRSNSTTVKVPKDALAALLRDHSRLIKEAEGGYLS